MKRFYCLGAGLVIGTVEALDGDLAWSLALLVQPQTECLREILA